MRLVGTLACCKKPVLHTEVVPYRFFFRWGWTGAATSNFGLALYYLSCSLATDKLNAALQHAPETPDFGRNLAMSYRFFLLSKQLATDVDPKYDAPIVAQSYHYVHLSYFDLLRLKQMDAPHIASSGMNNERLDVLTRIQRNLSALKLTHSWAKWHAQTLETTLKLTALTIAHELVRNADPKEEKHPSVLATAVKEAIELLAYADVPKDDPFYHKVQMMWDFHYYLHARAPTTRLAMIRSGEFFLTRPRTVSEVDVTIRTKHDNSVAGLVPNFAVYTM